MLFYCVSFVNKYNFFFAAVKPKKHKNLEMSRNVEEQHDTKTELCGMKTDDDSVSAVSRKLLKAEKKLKSVTPSDTATKTTDSQHSAVAAAIKRLPSQSDRNSGVVRIIEKSQHKRVPKTDDIEEALQLDVGIGSYDW